EYFVRERCAPEVEALSFEGIDAARPTTEALAALHDADLIVIAPSNPLVSIAPILGITGIRENIARASAPVFAVSPLIAGKVVKGPADRMMSALGHRADGVGVAERYRGIAQHFVIDSADEALSEEVTALGMVPHVTDIMMPDAAAKAGLARHLMDLFAATEAGRAA
ncbi:MAG: 2-phospho-L-lactate transferase CofD family protein, partial [Pseudomonadota bacterium]